MFPAWIYGVVALAIALIAFGIGQVMPGAGIVFVVLASTVLTAYAANRQRRLNQG